MDAIVEATYIEKVLVCNENNVRIAFPYSSKVLDLLQGLKIPQWRRQASIAGKSERKVGPVQTAVPPWHWNSV